MRSTPGRAVELARSFIAPGMLAVGRRSLEDHVFQEVGHARLAVALVPRADQDRQVDSDLGTRLIREQEHAQPVIEAIFGDPLDGGDFLGWFGLRLSAGG